MPPSHDEGNVAMGGGRRRPERTKKSDGNIFASGFGLLFGVTIGMLIGIAIDAIPLGILIGISISIVLSATSLKFH